MYAVADDEIAVHLYGENTARLELAGTKVTLQQVTNYPWGGSVSIKLGLETPARFALSLRIPEWVSGASLSVNGSTVDLDAVMLDGYARIEREWGDGDEVSLELPLKLRPQYANPKVRQDVGRVALMRGPLVYCAEEVDNGGDLNAIVVPSDLPDAKTSVVQDLGGAVALELPVKREETANWGTSLYRSIPAARRDTNLRLVPYHLWDNRAPGEMLVWLQAEKQGG
jgi:uncharacterized protein